LPPSFSASAQKTESHPENFLRLDKGDFRQYTQVYTTNTVK
jgi:hypothetical protein